MKLHQYFLIFIVLIGIFGLTSKLILQPALNYGITPNENMTLMLTGLNNSEYKNNIENIQVTAEDDGFLAQFKLAKAVYTAGKTTLTQSGAIISNLGGFIDLPEELTNLIILILIVLAIFAGIYLMVGA